MKKKVVYAGIIVLIIAIASLLLASWLAHSILPVTQYNMTVGSNSFYYKQIGIANTTRFFLIFISKGAANLYLFNSSAFAVWNSHINSNDLASGIAEAKALEGSGTMEIFQNTTLASFPSISNKTSEAVYSVNSLQFVPGNYYIVIDNTNGSESSSERFNATILVPESSYIS
ncbi:MAG: hypothetical protein QXK65_02555, partial [Candidatus Micrarchaeaceae archaeon]